MYTNYGLIDAPIISFDLWRLTRYLKWYTFINKRVHIEPLFTIIFAEEL